MGIKDLLNFKAASKVIKQTESENPKGKSKVSKLDDQRNKKSGGKK